MSRKNTLSFRDSCVSLQWSWKVVSLPSRKTKPKFLWITVPSWQKPWSVAKVFFYSRILVLPGPQCEWPHNISLAGEVCEHIHSPSCTGCGIWLVSWTQLCMTPDSGTSSPLPQTVHTNLFCMTFTRGLISLCGIRCVEMSKTKSLGKGSDTKHETMYLFHCQEKGPYRELEM